MNLKIFFSTIFSQQKFFNRDSVIGNPILNFFGLHVFRIVLAEAISNYRIWKLEKMNLISREDVNSFKENGFIVKPNFLSEPGFATLQKEVFESDDPEAFDHHDGTTTVHLTRLTEKSLEKLPECQKFIDHAEFHHLTTFGSTTTQQKPKVFLEKMTHGARDEDDPQKTFHSDTFHTTLKFWFYLMDITSENGAFYIIPGTHRLSWRRLWWEYKKSLSAKNIEDSDGTGSFRVRGEDFKTLNLPEPKWFLLPQNTFVLANTRAFHRRGSAAEGETRISIYGYNRVNPFVSKI